MSNLYSFAAMFYFKHDTKHGVMAIFFILILCRNIVSLSKFSRLSQLAPHYKNVINVFGVEKILLLQNNNFFGCKLGAEALKIYVILGKLGAEAFFCFFFGKLGANYKNIFITFIFLLKKEQ